MAAVLYKDYRIEIRPLPIPGGWSANVHMWNFQSGTTRVIPLVIPTQIAFLSQEAAHAYAEKVARQWVDQRQESHGEQTPEHSSTLADEDQREGMTGYGRLRPK